MIFQANQGILRHEKKRKIEVKVAELEDLLVDQNDLSPEQIQEKVRDAHTTNRYLLPVLTDFQFTK